MDKRFATAASFAFIIITVFYFIYLSPMMADVFVFSRDIRPGFGLFYAGSDVTAAPMTFAGAFRQACEMYYTWCGRFGGNLIFYLLTMLPHGLYCLVAAALFGCYVFLLHVCIAGRNWLKSLSPGKVLGLAALLWVGLPSFGEAFFWLSVGGEIALIGQAAILLPFRFALDGTLKTKTGANILLICGCFAFFLAGMFVASLDYATSAALPLTVIACSCAVWWRNSGHKIPVLLLCGTVGICLGAFLTLSAPGNAGRLLLSNDPAVHAYLATSWPSRILNWLSHLPIALLREWLPLLLITVSCFALWKQYGKSWIRQLPLGAFLFLMPALLTHGAYLFTPWPPVRAFATCWAQLLICGCIIFDKARQHGYFTRQFSLLTLALAIFCGISLLYEANKFYNLHKIIVQREEILQSGKKSVSLPPMPVGSGDRYWVLDKYVQDIACDSSFWINRAMAVYYDLDEVRLEGCSRTAWQPPDHVDAPEIFINRDNIEARSNGTYKDGAPLHFYYYGEPALLCRFPVNVGKKILQWLAEGESNSWRTTLIPILLARTDIVMKPADAGHLAGKSPKLKLFSDKNFWMVSPGQNASSFNLLPLKSREANNVK